MLEDVERRLVGRARDLDMRRPVAERLVGGDGRLQHARVDVREERGFALRHLCRGRGDQPGATLAVSAHEGLRHVAGQPLARRCEAGERTGADGVAERGDDVAVAVVLELLRRRALQVDVLALASLEGCDHLLRRAGVDRADRAVVEAALVTGVLEHDRGLAAVIDQHAAALEAVPAEIGLRLAPDQEEAILFVDLREVQRRRCLALVERGDRLRRRRLRDVHAAVDQSRDRRLARRRDRVLRPEAFLLEIAAGDGRDER